jgi:hypothetical protein
MQALRDFRGAEEGEDGDDDGEDVDDEDEDLVEVPHAPQDVDGDEDEDLVEVPHAPQDVDGDEDPPAVLEAPLAPPAEDAVPAQLAANGDKSAQTRIVSQIFLPRSLTRIDVISIFKVNILYINLFFSLNSAKYRL